MRNLFAGLLAFLLTCLALVLLALLVLVFYLDMPQGPAALLAIVAAWLGVGICGIAFVLDGMNEREAAFEAEGEPARPVADAVTLPPRQEEKVEQVTPAGQALPRAINEKHEHV